MAAADVTVSQDGGQSSVRLHPYVLALIRWCVSCVWSAGSVLLHRLMVSPLPAITGTSPRVKGKPRPASRDHLHPEALVECVVLHQPATVDLDIIFIHGLYGSLSNTWRQGEWRPKYKSGPTMTLLRNTDPDLNSCCNNSSKDADKRTDKDISIKNESENKDFGRENDITDDQLYADLKAMIQEEDLYITNNFYNKTMLDQVEIIDNYETQAQFVRDLFEYENEKYESNLNNNLDQKDDNSEETTPSKCDCDVNDQTNCEIGCGCICDECYSSCWPKDWIKMDYPNARVISINYTSDPHLWRPLWIKESKRLRLHERADQMIYQLLNLGVGQKPVIWVGHSKGGLFIKQIYCEAYEAFLKSKNNHEVNVGNKYNNIKNESNDNEKYVINNDIIANKEINNIESHSGEKCDIDINRNIAINKKPKGNLSGNDLEVNTDSSTEQDRWTCNHVRSVEKTNEENSTSLVDVEDLRAKSRLWSNSAGFMFYSVPHRGSPLADFKTPITARSIELLEICKDCSLVLSLQERWEAATRRRPSPAVRSLVEDGRTLMSVLWLRIVSVDSADAGIGPLHGVSLDHREICKPSSRRCLLYIELMRLIEEALNRH